MELKWLEDFVALARIGSFSKAAAQRYVTQPAFSRRIRALEEWIGAQLFDRESNPINLTEAGKEFLPRAIRITAEAASVKKDFQLLYGTGTSSIRVITSHRLSANFVPRLVSGFLRKNPGIRVSVVPKMDSTERYGDCTDALITGMADFLITYDHELLIFDQKMSASLECIEVGRDQIVPVTSPAYAAKIQPNWYENKDSRIDYVGYPDYSFTETIIHPILLQFEKQLNKVYESPFTGSIRAMLLEGVGITWLPLSVVADDLLNGRLICLEGENLSTDLRVMVYRRRESTGPVMENFWRHLADPEVKIDSYSAASTLPAAPTRQP
jgi:DNA-binding transcriptional LysR family regulator